MFVQHMVSVLHPGGMVVTIMPHGVLFRGGAEREIRTGFLDEDLLDAVIGLGPNLFYGTGIPACLLVLRAPGAKPEERRGKVLFINADREYFEGRAQNYLHPEHIEKITSAWDAFEDIDGFARVVDRSELRENDDNLNIRRYAENAPPPEPHDVRAHRYGGVPKAEVEAKAELFAACGLDPMHLFEERDEPYVDFRREVATKADLAAQIDSDEGVRGRKEALAEAVESWWAESRDGVARLPETQTLMELRAQLLSSFEIALRAVGVLDRFQVAGVIATWWGEVQDDLRTLAARGFLGLVGAWETSILAAVEEKGSKEDPFGHRLVKRLLPEYLDQIADLEAERAELDATIKAATTSAEGEDGEENGAADAEGDDEEAPPRRSSERSRSSSRR